MAIEVHRERKRTKYPSHQPGVVTSWGSYHQKVVAFNCVYHNVGEALKRSLAEGGCDHKGSLSQVDTEGEKPKDKGTCKHADQYTTTKGSCKCDKGTGCNCSADHVAGEGPKCDKGTGCSADAFEDHGGKQCDKGTGCNADSFNGDGVKGHKADKFNPSKRSGKDSDRFDTGKGSNSKDSRKHVDKYEHTREGTCKGGKGSLAEMDLSEGDGEEKPTVTYNHDDNFKSDSNYNQSNKYDTGKSDIKDVRKHVDKYETTNEGGYRSSSLTELDDCTDEQKSDPNSKCFVQSDEENENDIV